MKGLRQPEALTGIEADTSNFRTVPPRAPRAGEALIEESILPRHGAIILDIKQSFVGLMYIRVTKLSLRTMCISRT
ncbi:hypothetical protein EVJ58_g467 [Rhodofomes roseus]|uniref:Uncharacterized protein n=1 Tax=Rhodofomes roseus TaxID=34475 RepID=A0A4Y9Z404_9APHY|nr:hypothetical protein EVJ58_g467 [Rhodofomes roseus]